MKTIEECLRAGAKGVMISNQDYHALPGLSGSAVPLFVQSFKHFDNKNLFDLDQTEDMLLGSVVHKLVLEPDDYKNEYFVMPALDLRTKAGKREKQRLEDEHPDKTLISLAMMKTALKMAENVMQIYGDIVDGSIKERSLFSKIGGLVVKCRLDMDYQSENFDIDLKKISLNGRPFSDHVLRNHIIDMNYHYSAAFRNIVRDSLGIETTENFLLFVDSGNGHKVKMIELESSWIQQCMTEIYETIEVYNENDGVDLLNQFELCPVIYKITY